MADSGDYICTATDPDGRNPVDSSPARINVRPGINILQFAMFYYYIHLNLLQPFKFTTIFILFNF